MQLQTLASTGGMVIHDNKKWLAEGTFGLWMMEKTSRKIRIDLAGEWEYDKKLSQVKRRRKEVKVKEVKYFVDENKLGIEISVRLQRVLSSIINSFTMTERRKTVNKGVENEGHDQTKR